jgi:K(+)-stimulated pyrophosphate-energized sodium pump
MAGEKRPDYAPVIDICTAASLRELATPALLAVLAPVMVGFALGPIALGAFLAAVILTGQLMAVYLSNAGGAWDNAKKYIEDGHLGGKGSEAHKAAVIGDTVGDPFKDTAGPALNPLIKVMNLVSLLILPAIIAVGTVPDVSSTDIAASVTAIGDYQPSAASYVIAAVALLVLIIAIGYSKLRGGTVLGTEEAAAPAAEVAAPATANAVSAGDEPVKLAIDALDRWIYDLGDEEASLRRQLRAAKADLEGAAAPPDGG